MGSDERQEDDPIGIADPGNDSPFPPLPGELSIYTATEIHGAWTAWLAGVSDRELAEQTSVTVDAAAVETIDGAGMQLLLSLRRSLEARGLGLLLAEPSAALRAACAALGTAARLTPVPSEAAR